KFVAVTVLYLYCVTGCNFAISPLKQEAAVKGIAYFPTGALGGFEGFFSEYLKLLGEPSLLNTVQDPNANSYRFTWLSGQHGYRPAVRLSINSDGSAVITVADLAGAPPTPRATQVRVSRVDVHRLLERIEKADFWSMPSSLPQEDAAQRHKAYMLDAS